MPRRTPSIGRTGLFLAAATAVAFTWDLAVHAWTSVPGAAAAALAADPRLLRAEDLPPGGVAALLDTEDPRFFAHSGVDSALGSATITERVADRLWPDGWDPVVGPLEHKLVALIVDARIDKDTQMILFMNTVPMGLDGEDPVVGLDEASMAWFGKRCAELDPDEFQTLVSMIRPSLPLS